LNQLRALGLCPSAVRERVAAGKLHRVHRGVYSVGHSVLSVEGRWMAAVLACGPGAVLSHRSAAALWGLRPSARARIDVTAPRRAGRVREGIDVHSGATLLPRDVTSVRGIPCTTVARTLLDLAEVVDRRGVERACDQAEVLRLYDGKAVDDVLGRATGRHGASRLHAVLAEYEVGENITHRELEERFLLLCRNSNLPKPKVNAWVQLPDGAVQADFLWADERLIVETDGRATHGTRRSFESDRRRDQRLLVAGWHVMRRTWRQVTREPTELVESLRTQLARRDGWRE
jgi:very-short-patch-repair endonuclease